MKILTKKGDLLNVSAGHDMKFIDQYLSRMDNWALNVLGFTIFLSLIGFGSLGLLAYLKWKITGTFVYAVMFLVGMVILFISLIPAYKLHTFQKRADREKEAQDIINKLKGINSSATNWPGPL